MQRLIAAGGNVQRIGAGLHKERHLLQGVFKIGATFNVLGGTDAKADGEIRPAHTTYLAHDVAGKARAIRHAAAVLVVAPVGTGGQELANEIAMAAMHLDTIKACVLRAARTLAKGLNEVLDLQQRQRARHHAGSKMHDGRGRRGNHGAGFLRGAGARVVQLHEDLGIMLVHRVCQFLQAGNQLVVIDAHAARAHAHFGKDARHAGHQEARAALGALLHKGNVFVQHIAIVMAVTRAHRRHDDAVLEFQGSDAARLE